VSDRLIRTRDVAGMPDIGTETVLR
jgi:hypothetical protein